MHDQTIASSDNTKETYGCWVSCLDGLLISSTKTAFSVIIQPPWETENAQMHVSYVLSFFWEIQDNERLDKKASNTAMMGSTNESVNEHMHTERLDFADCNWLSLETAEPCTAMMQQMYDRMCESMRLQGC